MSGFLLFFLLEGAVTHVSFTCKPSHIVLGCWKMEKISADRNPHQITQKLSASIDSSRVSGKIYFYYYFLRTVPLNCAVVVMVSSSQSQRSALCT